MVICRNNRIDYFNDGLLTAAADKGLDHSVYVEIYQPALGVLSAIFFPIDVSCSLHRH